MIFNSGLGFFWEPITLGAFLQSIALPVLFVITVIGLGIMLARKNKRRAEK